MPNPLINAHNQLDTIAKLIDLDPDIVAQLKSPERILKFSIPVKMDDGKTKIFQGFRSQHNSARGPYKGGIRFHEGVTEEEVIALSTWMTWKTATTEIPLGGGKGGVIVNPKELSETELERLSRGFIRAIAEYIGPDIDIPAPDVNTTPQIMAWMMDEYKKLKPQSNAYAMITGKPLELGGSEGRGQATAQGGIYILEEIARDNKLNPETTTIAIQGFGNAGYWFAKLASDLGFKVVAVSDSSGAIYEDKGLDIAAAIGYKSAQGGLSGYQSNQISNEELLELDVDILVPAALENVITEKNASKIKAKYIIELANGPVTPEADAVLFKKGITSIPDILANAGGVTVSYFEWVQNRIGEYWTEDTVLEKLQPMMVNAYRNVAAKAKELKVDMRMGAYALAVSRVAEAMKAKK